MAEPVHGVRGRASGALCALLLLTASPTAPSAATDILPLAAARGDCAAPTLLRGETAPIGTAPCPGVRPGAILDADGGKCTANFLFQGSDGARYIGTAGHCTLEARGEIVYRAGTGPEVHDAEGERIGEIAYAILEGKRDFSLVRLDPGVKAKAQMCFFGGPTGIYKEFSPDPVTLTFFGNGTGIGNVGAINQPLVPARTGMAADTTDPDIVYAVAPANKGDSGAAVTEESSGRAVGVLVGVGAEGVWITRIGPQIAGAERALAIDLTLRTPR